MREGEKWQICSLQNQSVEKVNCFPTSFFLSIAWLVSETHSKVNIFIYWIILNHLVQMKLTMSNIILRSCICILIILSVPSKLKWHQKLLSSSILNKLRVLVKHDMMCQYLCVICYCGIHTSVINAILNGN